MPPGLLPPPLRVRVQRPRPALLAAVFLAAALLSGCAGSLHLAESDHPRVLANQVIPGQSPSTPGPFEVGFLTYGSGADRQRPEYAEGVAFTTTSVDASPFAQRTARARYWRRYWGFDENAYPRNGRVWYPKGDGPFPLVLVVHGNHDPRRSSDRGYAYLGELLASRGFIVTSVDMNFLNGQIRGENDARGWMLLKHLEAWKEFTDDPENPFHEKVDWDRIALMGHSRGGEAVGHAAAFNQLRHYPDDGRITFDFDFRIRSLVAIAPVDGQYRPAELPVPLEDVNYLVFHGSHDGDVTSFAGLRQYQRVSFTREVPAFKSSVYVYRANHGQWNTGWGPLDNGPRSPRILRLDGLMPMEDQLEFGRVWITAFLEATLLGEERWLPLFRDHRTAGDWLPPTMYKTRFEHSSFVPLADFTEDIDLTTGTTRGVTLEGEGLSTWREGELVLRSRLTPQQQVSQQARAVWLGFHRVEAGGEVGTGSNGDLQTPDPSPRWTVHLAEGVAAEAGFGPGATLDFVMGATSRRPPPVEDEEEGAEDGAEEGADAGKIAPFGESTRTSTSTPIPENDRPVTAPTPTPIPENDRPVAGENGDPDGTEGPLDLSVVVVDEAGAAASLPLSAFGPLREPLEIRILRRSDVEADRFPTLHEVVGHHFSLPLDEFVAVNPGLRADRIREIRFHFDRSPVGEVWITRLGVSRPDPAFMEPRVPVHAGDGGR